MSARSGSSLNQKHLKESLSSKELHSMEKHLADMEKDLSMKVESKLSRSPNSPHNSLLIPTHQGTLQTLPIQNSRSQTPASQAGKSIQLQLLGSKVSPVANTRVQTPSNPSSRPQTPNTQTSRPKTPSAQGSRPATPNSLLSRPSASSIHENKEENIATQRSRPVTPSSQVGKPLYKASGVSAQVTEETAGTSTQRSTLSE
uniref:Uncharacterized protein n=1 Tax=Latimeria chalumnae TaxID=7897 RepID=H3B1G1_LATCH